MSHERLAELHTLARTLASAAAQTQPLAARAAPQPRRTVHVDIARLSPAGVQLAHAIDQLVVSATALEHTLPTLRPNVARQMLHAATATRELLVAAPPGHGETEAAFSNLQRDVEVLQGRLQRLLAEARSTSNNRAPANQHVEETWRRIAIFRGTVLQLKQTWGLLPARRKLPHQCAFMRAVSSITGGHRR